MCDYSLMGVPNRLAQEGEDLVTYRFPTGSLGLAPAGTCTQAGGVGTRAGFWSMLKAFMRGEPAQAVAVCVPPGARLLLGDIPEPLQHSLGIGPAEEVTFTQLTATPHMYRDAFRFKNGAELLLQRLSEGQRVRVLDCAAQANPLGTINWNRRNFDRLKASGSKSCGGLPRSPKSVSVPDRSGASLEARARKGAKNDATLDEVPENLANPPPHRTG